MSKMATRLQRTLARASRGEAAFTLSPLGDRGEPRPGVLAISGIANAIAWEDVQAASQPKVSINLRVRPDVLDFFRGDDPRGYQRRINAVLEAYALTNRRRPRRPPVVRRAAKR
jgi:uncharacterized protein (DUF4415 family)